jgi:hypothetical protein
MNRITIPYKEAFLILLITAQSGCEKRAANGSESGGEQVDLVTQLPPELIEGTPKPAPVLPVPYEKSYPKAAPTTKVPIGTTNVARGKPVSSSALPSVGDLELLTDGEKSNNEGNYIEFPWVGTDWVQVDLGRSYGIHAIWLWHTWPIPEVITVSHDVIVRVSSDPDFSKDVVTVFNNDYDNSSALGIGHDAPYRETCFGKLVPVNNVTGRYVRVYGRGNTANQLNRFIELEVFATSKPNP